MGIRGLTRYIKEHPEYLEDYQLHDTRVVVDGNNLCHFLYSVSYQYGGDYDHYAREVRSFFERFRDCRISPVIVFDGGDDVDDRKLATLLSRATERICRANFLSHAGKGHVLPIMAYQTFQMVLDELEIQHVTCDNEADNEIPVLANAWGCPVLSNDSDFFIFDLTHGFILLDHLDLTIQTSAISHRYLKARIYYLNTLLVRFPSIERRQIALFATLLGNDYVPREWFDRFFADAEVFRRDRSRFAQLLAWLESVGTVNESVLQLLRRYIPADEHETIKGLIQRSVDSYTKLDTNLLDHSRSDTACPAVDFTVRTSLNNNLPTWFLEGVRCGRLPVFLVNIARLHRVIFLCQVGNRTECSTYSTVLQLRRLLYGILLSTDKNCRDKVGYIHEYGRVGEGLELNYVEPLFDLPDGRDVPSLERIPELHLDERQAVFYSALGFNDTVAAFLCCGGTEFLLAVIVYWAKHAIPAIKWRHIYCLIACWLKLSIIDVQTAKKKSQTKQNDSAHGAEGFCSRCRLLVTPPPDVDRQTASRNMQRFTAPPYYARMHPFDGSIIHSFSQFQACFLYIHYLNVLLLEPLSSVSIAHVFNGTFLYSLNHEMNHHPTDDKKSFLYVCDLLGRNSDLRAYFTEVIDVLEELLAGDICEEKQPRLKQSRHKRDRISREVETGASVTPSDASLNESQVNMATKVEYTCLVENQFGALAIDNDDDNVQE